ncbi:MULTISPECIES: hypothetical protein [unclassified Bradyrhizobium]|uniref:hypothetical protein n=1 Tax=unclassified Bradyrhizobium TaxID=2631580 RepID=UPI0028ED68B0|nr:MULTISPECIES: hypothetical protein [unclassified Bradyrhizobium]
MSGSTTSGLLLMALKIMLAGFAVFPLVLLWFGGPIVWTALRTGRLLGRGAVYDRDVQPKMYFFGLVFWLCIFLVVAGNSVLVLMHVDDWLFN